MARPLAIDPYIFKKFLENKCDKVQIPTLTSGSKKIDSIFPLDVIWYTNQIHTMGKNKLPDPRSPVWLSIFKTILSVGFEGIKRMRA